MNAMRLQEAETLAADRLVRLIETEEMLEAAGGVEIILRDKLARMTEQRDAFRDGWRAVEKLVDNLNQRIAGMTA